MKTSTSLKAIKDLFGKMKLLNFYNGRPIYLRPQEIDAVTETPRAKITLVLMKSGRNFWVTQTSGYVNRLWREGLRRHLSQDFYG